jgi:hypothetical protein
MAGKGAENVAGAGKKPLQPVQRLCNEIQLFDLCDLEKCGHKQGQYCTSKVLLTRFEAIAEEDEQPAVEGFVSGGLDDAEGTDDDGTDGEGYDDAFDDDQFIDEGYAEDQEDQ